MFLNGERRKKKKDKAQNPRRKKNVNYFCWHGTGKYRYLTIIMEISRAGCAYLLWLKDRI